MGGLAFAQYRAGGAALPPGSWARAGLWPSPTATQATSPTTGLLAASRLKQLQGL